MIDALVIFEDRNTHPLGHLLKPGFRHVWCAVLDERAHSWVGHNLRIDGYVTTALAAADYPLINYLEEDGCTVVPITRQPTLRGGPILLNNCVGVTKLICNIQSAAITPWQLYRHLVRSAEGETPCTSVPI